MLRKFSILRSSRGNVKKTIVDLFAVDKEGRTAFWLKKKLNLKCFVKFVKKNVTNMKTK